MFLCNKTSHISLDCTLTHFGKELLYYNAYSMHFTFAFYRYVQLSPRVYHCVMRSILPCPTLHNYMIHSLRVWFIFTPRHTCVFIARGQPIGDHLKSGDWQLNTMSRINSGVASRSYVYWKCKDENYTLEQQFHWTIHAFFCLQIVLNVMFQK